MQKVELRHWWEYGDEKTGMNELYEKRHVTSFLAVPWASTNCVLPFPTLKPGYLFIQLFSSNIEPVSVCVTVSPPLPVFHLNSFRRLNYS